MRENLKILVAAGKPAPDFSQSEWPVQSHQVLAFPFSHGLQPDAPGAKPPRQQPDDFALVGFEVFPVFSGQRSSGSGNVEVFTIRGKMNPPARKRGKAHG